MSVQIWTSRLLGAAWLATALSAGALAQQPGFERVRGTITAIDGPVLTLQTKDAAAVKVRLDDHAAVRSVLKAQLTDITPGKFVGITSFPQPDGSRKATEIHIFPEGARGTNEGQRPMDIGPGSMMTNATVSLIVTANTGPTVTVKYPGGETAVTVTPETQVVALALNGQADLKIGNKVVARATKSADGSYTASVVSVGRDGLTPPM